MISLGIVVNRQKDIDLKYTKILADSIQKSGGKLELTSDIANELGYVSQNSVIDMFEKSDMVVCLGGDGTFLKVVRMTFRKNIPIIGINLGSLGFLTEIDKNDIPGAIDSVINGSYSIEERMMLETSFIDEGGKLISDIALNDIVISRGALSRILHLKTYINNVFVDSFPGDGMIISSPTGSTAYSLSAGGPIVEPDTDLIIVTPICPHILYSRSIVTTGERVVKIIVDEESSHDAMVTADGQEGYIIRGGCTINIKKSPYTVKTVKIKSRNFFNILRTKIYDRGENLRKNEI